MRPPTRTPPSRLVLAAAILTLALGASAATALDADPGIDGLFSPSSIPGTLDITDSPTVMRYRYVDVGFDDLLNEDGSPKGVEPGHTLLLNLFDDAVHTAVLDRVDYAPDSDFAWLGHLQGVPYSHVVLVVGDGALVGNVTLPGASFQVRFAGSGVHAICEIDQSAFPPELPPVAAPQSSEHAAAASFLAANDQPVIDLLVVYTPRARTKVGGTKRMRELINLAVAETNLSYQNSQLDQRLNLVHYEEVDYVEETFPEALSHLTHTSDGVMDNVHALRRQYAADEVVLLIEDYTACGLAWLMTEVSGDFETYAFAIVNWNCAAGNYSLGHELGHNMGAQHDWYQYLLSYGIPPAFTYSFGFVNASAGWRTIMAYNDECEDRGLDCSRLPYWSNPDLTLDGEPMGVPEGTSTSCFIGEYDPNCDADNRKTLNATASTVSSFMGSTQLPSAPTALTATAILPTRVDLSWTDNSLQESGFRIERSPDGASDWATIGTVASNVTSYSDLGVVAESAYYYRVQAYNDMGASDYSNIAAVDTPASIPGPLLYEDQIVDDDRAGVSDGDRSGSVDCGEIVELEVSLENSGSVAVTGIIAELVTADPYVISTGNMASNYPTIEGQDSEYNTDEFAFEVAQNTPLGYLIHFDLDIVADNWGPGTVAVDVPVFCSTSASYLLYLPLILR